MGFTAPKAVSWCIAWVIAVCTFSLPLSGQTPSDLDPIAVRAAQGVAKTHQHRIFIAGLQNCLLDAELCTFFEATLRANVEKMIPGAQFVARESVVSLLASRGFIALDAYFPDVLRSVASAAGVETLVTDTLVWQPDGYELICQVYDAVHDEQLDGISAEIVRAVPESGREPIVFTDPDSRTSMIIVGGRPSRAPGFQYPTCERCPDASYTHDARAHRVQGRVVLLATITEKGRTDGVVVVSGLADGLTDKAVEAVRTWHFRPAIDKDGKPFAVRTPIEMNFRLD